MKLSKVAKLFRSIFSADPAVESVSGPEAQPSPITSASPSPDVIYHYRDFIDRGHRDDLVPGMRFSVIEKDGVLYTPLLAFTQGSACGIRHPIFTGYTGIETNRLAEFLGRPRCVISVKRPSAARPVLYISIDDLLFLFEREITIKRGQEFIKNFTGKCVLDRRVNGAKCRSRKIAASLTPEAAPELADAKVTVFDDVEVPQHIYEAMVSSRVGQVFSELMEIAQSLGLRGHEAAIYADNGIQKQCGFSVLEAMGMRGAPRPADDRLSYTPTELGATVDLSAIGFNKLLEQYGFQVRIRNKWQPTERGLPHCAVFDPYVSESETPSNRLQVRWFKSVLNELNLLMDEVPTTSEPESKLDAA